MKWTESAEQRLGKVPFFIRKKVRARVEKYVRDNGGTLVRRADIEELKTQYLSKGGMAKDMKGYDVSLCMGGDQCPNKAADCAALAADIEQIFDQAKLLTFLQSRVRGDLKFHHEFRVSLSGCPNACSRPQIVDIGIIGVARPLCARAECTHCHACDEVCKEKAVILYKGDKRPVFNEDCLLCGRCAAVCPSGTIEIGQTGYIVLLGGRLGRHPRLGMKVPSVLNYNDVLEVVENAIGFYKKNAVNGERFSHLLISTDQVCQLKDR